MVGRSLNVILFGETGAGKSSVINLIAGKDVAETSPDIFGSTQSCTSYTFELNGVSCMIWDTVGLNEPMVGITQDLRSVEQVCTLVKKLTSEGGIDLLLFCHRAGRITTNTRRNYALLHEVVCQKSVPTAVVITHLEQEECMEDWWIQNAAIFDQHQIKVFGHACVTALPEHPKREESRKAIETLLGGRGGRYGIPAEDSAEVELKGKDLERVLRDRCGFNARDAHRVAEIVAK